MNEREVLAWEDKIARFKVFDYPNWNIYLEPNQYYLGRLFAWAKRPSAIDILELRSGEWAELQQAIKDCAAVQASLFSPDLVNVSFLGNLARHCHGHVIPRYKNPRQFAGVDFADAHFGRHYNQPAAEAWSAGSDAFYADLVGCLHKAFLSEKC